MNRWKNLLSPSTLWKKVSQVHQPKQSNIPAIYTEKVVQNETVNEFQVFTFVSLLPYKI